MAVGKTYRDKQGVSGCSQGKSGKCDDPELAIEKAMMKKQKTSKGAKRKPGGKSE